MAGQRPLMIGVRARSDGSHTVAGLRVRRKTLQICYDCVEMVGFTDITGRPT